ncbi:MAG: Gfo/Idh/MocA family oxidoreductase [Rectinemataceae bacterium]|jgi:predicted dehydrogenase
MRVGVIGAGFMGSVHAAAWKKAGAEIVGILAETVEEAQPLAARLGARAYAELGSMLGDIEVLDICSPTHLHARQALAAAAAGRQIVCEKPLARNAEDGAAMIGACRKAGVHLMVAHVVRWFPEYELAKARAEAGDIGEIATLRFERLSYRPKKPLGNWFLDEAKSGGIILDLMIHDIDMARWIAGEARRVYARRVSQAAPDSPVDYGSLTITHESGSLSHIAGAWAYPPPVFRTGFEICGSKGVLRHDSAAESPVASFLASRSGEAPDVGLPSSPLAEDPYEREIAEFAACIESGLEPRVTAEDGLAALRIAVAAMESARTGRAVEIAPETGPEAEP